MAGNLREHRVCLLGALALLASLAGACRTEPKKGPQTAVRRWNRALRDRDCSLLYEALDEKSKWAVMSMARDAVSASRLIQARYRGQARMRELSKLGLPVVTKDAKRLFAALCERERFIDRLRERHGPIRKVRTEGGRATAVTARGTKLFLERDDYGRWGVTVLRNDLRARALRLSNIRKAIRGLGENAP